MIEIVNWLEMVLSPGYEPTYKDVEIILYLRKVQELIRGAENENKDKRN